MAGKHGGPEFLRELLSRLGGKRYNGDELMADLIKGLLAKEGDAGEGAEGSTGSGKFFTTAAAPFPAATRPYRLVLRDLFISPYLTGGELEGTGVGRVQKDMLCVSPEDAAALDIADGEALRLESATGAVVRPVTVKAGIKRGVIECFLFRQRGDVLALSPGMAKVIGVSVTKA